MGLAWDIHINMVGIKGEWELNPPLLITGQRTAIYIYAQIRFCSINHILWGKKKNKRQHKHG
jgi:hypothetical protein